MTSTYAGELKVWSLGEDYFVEQVPNTPELTLVEPAGAETTFGSLSEIAMALNCSGLVLSEDASPAEIAAAALAGYRKVGPEELRELDSLAQELVQHQLDNGCLPAEDRGVSTDWGLERSLWGGDLTRERLFTALAFRLLPKHDIPEPVRPEQERYAQAVIGGRTMKVPVGYRFTATTAPDMWVSVQMPVSYEDIVAALCALVFTGDCSVGELEDTDPDELRARAVEVLINLDATEIDDARDTIDQAEPGSVEYVLTEQVRAVVARAFTPLA